VTVSYACQHILVQTSTKSAHRRQLSWYTGRLYYWFSPQTRCTMIWCSRSSFGHQPSHVKRTPTRQFNHVTYDHWYFLTNMTDYVVFCHTNHTTLDHCSLYLSQSTYAHVNASKPMYIAFTYLVTSKETSLNLCCRHFIIQISNAVYKIEGNQVTTYVDIGRSVSST